MIAPSFCSKAMHSAHERLRRVIFFLVVHLLLNLTVDLGATVKNFEGNWRTKRHKDEKKVI